MIPSIEIEIQHGINRGKLQLTVHQAELRHHVTDVWVTVERAGNTMRCPTSVGHRSLAEEDLVHIDRSRMTIAIGIAVGDSGRRGGDRFGDVLAKSCDLSNFLEENDGGFGTVSIDPDTYRYFS